MLLEEFDARHRTMVRVLWAHAIALPVLALVYGNTVPHALLEAVLVGTGRSPPPASADGGRAR